MTARVLTLLVLLLSSALPLAALRPRDPDAGWTAPASAAAKANPLANRLDAAEGGRKIFAERCSTCHGDDAEGTEYAPDLMGAVIRRQSDGTLYWKISSGNTRTGMPTFSYLPPLQRWQLVLFLRAGSQRGGDSNDRSFMARPLP